MRDIDMLVVHCSATKAALDVDVEDIRRWHTEAPRNWSDIGYHYVITRAGDLQKGRPVERTGAHCKGHNSTSLGICMVGGLNASGEPENNFTAPQFETLELLVESLVTSHPGAEVLGHRDLSPDVDGDGEVEEWEWVKDCPCFDVRVWHNA